MACGAPLPLDAPAGAPFDHPASPEDPLRAEDHLCDDTLKPADQTVESHLGLTRTALAGGQSCETASPHAIYHQQPPAERRV